MPASPSALRAAWDGRGVLAVRAVPFVVLLASIAGVLLTPEGSHYGLLIAVVPAVAAAVHGVHVTAVLGALAVIAYAALRFRLGDGDSDDIWAVPLASIAVVALVGVLVARVRDRERRLARVRDTALRLQQGLLPRAFPENSGVEVCHRYVPADTVAGVGGDWFDVIRLSGARVALVVGDVAGRGVAAAAMMGRLRTAMHTLADLDLAPEEVLVRMDDLVLRLGECDGDGAGDGDGGGDGDVGGDGGPESAAACLYLVYDPVSGRCSAARAGHPLPLMLTPDGTVRALDLPANPPLGLGGTPFESAGFALEEGSVLALYTDGLLGLRHRAADEATDRLASALPPGRRPLREICDSVFATLADSGPADDMALLVARTRLIGADRVASWRFPAEPRAVAEARSVARRTLRAWGLEEKAFETELVVSELVTNAVTHACGPVGLRLIHDRALICEVSDGTSTSPHLRHARLMDEGGRGLYLVGRLAQRWGTRHSPDGKTIWAEQSLAAAGRDRATP